MTRPVAGRHELRGTNSYSWDQNTNRFNKDRSPFERRAGTIYLDQSFMAAAVDEYADRMAGGVKYDIGDVEPNFDVPDNYPNAMRIRHEEFKSRVEGLKVAFEAVDFGVKVGQRSENYLMIDVYNDYLAGQLQFQVFDFARPSPNMPYAPRQLYIDDPKYLEIIKELRK